MTLRTYKPLRSRTRLSAKPKKEKRVSWRSGRIREDAAGIAKLRAASFTRSGGTCECWMTGRTGLTGCGKRVTWAEGEMHHLQSRAHGGSDVLENVAFIREECHEAITGKPQWGRR